MIYSKPNLTKTEKEEESLEEPWLPYLKRYTSRPMFVFNQAGVLSLLYLSIKCLYRLLQGSDPETSEWPWWCALSSSVLFTTLELTYITSACELAKGRLRSSHPYLSRSEGSDVSLRDPLLGSDTAPSTANSSKESSPVAAGGKIGSGLGKEGPAERLSEVPEPDICAEAGDYKAGWTDLLKVCSPDLHLIIFAFLNLALAAVAQVYIPHFTGKILDALGADDGGTPEGDVWDVPGFSENVRLLAISAVACGFFSGARGSVFTVVGGRVNARLR